MLGEMLLVLMSESSLPDQSDAYLQKQILSLSSELSVCAADGQYQSLFSLTLLSYYEGDTEWSLSQLIDSSFMSCPRTFMVALKAARPEIREKVILLFGKYGDLTVLAEFLWRLQDDKDVGVFVRKYFSDFGVVVER